jgi:hypothetical protein
MWILLGLSMLLGALWADPRLLPRMGPGAWMLPQIVILGLAGVLAWTVRRQKRLGRLFDDAIEAVQLRRWEMAEGLLRAILSRPMNQRLVRAESLLALGRVAEAERGYDAAQRVYEALLREGVADPLQMHMARVALAGAMLRTGQVADAVALTDKLQRSGLEGLLKAQVELLALLRDVVMGQVESGVEHAVERRALFREHLGTRAAYGYALLAAAFDRAGQTESARSHWYDATLLVKPAELLGRYDEVKGVAARYPAAEWAI